MRDLLEDPLWREEDLGRPVPDSVHAVSVCLPRWAHVIGYEEKDPAVTGKMFCGYPRFFRHRYVGELLDAARVRFCEGGEGCMVFPSAVAARRCLDYVARKTGAAAGGRIEDYGVNGMTVAIFPEGSLRYAGEYLRYCGEVVSSRLARESLDGTTPRDAEERGLEAKRLVRRRLAELSGQEEGAVFLYPSGMAAMAAVQRMLAARSPGKKTVQLDFPYVDVLRVQQEFGAGAHFLPVDGEGNPGAELAELVRGGGLAGIYTEVASNPLLRTADVVSVSGLARESGIPLVVDDTVGTVVNVDVSGYADVITTSLTKYFSGTGDVLAGSVIIPRGSICRESFLEFLRGEGEGGLWSSDAVALEENSRDFAERVNAINANGAEMFAYLRSHPKVERVYYPMSEARGAYDALRREGGGYGGLLSMDLAGGEAGAAAFYDALRVSKGPSLGTGFTLVCPYTLLAHYDELGWAEACGVGRNLIRVSVGTEEIGELKGRFAEAFAAMPD